MHAEFRLTCTSEFSIAHAEAITCNLKKAYIQPFVTQLLPADSEDITRARLNFDSAVRSWLARRAPRAVGSRQPLHGAPLPVAPEKTSVFYNDRSQLQKFLFGARCAY